MERLTIEEAKRLNDTMVTEDHLKLHAANVAACMGAMAEHFGEDRRAAGVPEEDIRAILSHGYTIRNDVEPLTPMEKSLFPVDDLSGIIQAAARMRPNGIEDMELKSFMKKWKDKRFAAKCNRELILKGCELLAMDIRDVADICIKGMKDHADELGLSAAKLAEQA